MRILFLIIAYIFIEIALFSAFGGAIGTLPVLILVALGFFVGRYFITRSGHNARNWMREAQSGVVNTDMSGQLAMMIGGLLVILPGFFTDIIGVLLIFPPTRQLLSKMIGFRMASRNVTNPNYQKHNADIIEGEILETDREQ